MTEKPIVLVSIVVAGLQISTVASAQVVEPPRGLAVGGTVGFFTLNVDDFDNAGSGPGFNGFVRYDWPSGVSLSGAVQYSIQSIDADEDLGIVGVFVDPRYYVRMAGSSVARPFVGARGGYVHASTSISGQDVNANGWALGGAAGVQLRLGPRMVIEGTGSLTGILFVDLERGAADQPTSDKVGNSLGLFASLVYFFR